MADIFTVASKEFSDIVRGKRFLILVVIFGLVRRGWLRLAGLEAEDITEFDQAGGFTANHELARSAMNRRLTRSERLMGLFSRHPNFSNVAFYPSPCCRQVAAASSRWQKTSLKKTGKGSGRDPGDSWAYLL